MFYYPFIILRYMFFSFCLFVFVLYYTHFASRVMQDFVTIQRQTLPLVDYANVCKNVKSKNCKTIKNEKIKKNFQKF